MIRRHRIEVAIRAVECGVVVGHLGQIGGFVQPIFDIGDGARHFDAVEEHFVILRVRDAVKDMLDAIGNRLAGIGDHPCVAPGLGGVERRVVVNEHAFVKRHHDVFQTFGDLDSNVGVDGRRVANCDHARRCFDDRVLRRVQTRHFWAGGVRAFLDDAVVNALARHVSRGVQIVLGPG